METLESLSYSEQNELCALIWLGRYDKDEDSERDNFSKLQDEADKVVGKDAIAGYLFEITLKDSLINGLKKL